MPISIVPIVIGILGYVSLDQSKWLKVLDFDYQVILLLQQTVLLIFYGVIIIMIIIELLTQFTILVKVVM